MDPRIRFLIALGNLIKNGAVKTVKQAMNFAEQQFGKIDKSFVDDIVKVFKKEGKTKKGDVVPIKKKEGIMETSKATDVLSKAERTRLGYPNRSVEGMARAAARDILMKRGIEIGGKDPIDVLRITFGDDALDAVDNIAEGLMDVTDYKTLSKRIEAEGLYKLKAKPKAEYDAAVKSGEELRMLDEFDIDPDRKPNAEGGLINILKL
jgi:hypothetical protein